MPDRSFEFGLLVGLGVVVVCYLLAWIVGAL